jgi:glycosyltransferase involved in cell wall biosynthesis
MCPEKGLDILIEAFLILKSDRRFERLKLRVGGGKIAADEPYFALCRKRLKQSGWAPDAEFLREFDRSSRIAFLQSLSVLSVPARHREAFGLYVLEALAAGVPVVLPSEGAFPEILEATGGGVLYEPNDAGSLARALGKLLTDTARARELGRRGRAVVLEKFSMDNMTADFLRVCKQLCEEYEALRRDAGHPIREDQRV